MPDAISIELPGGFAPGCAIGHDDGAGGYVAVSAERPLPVIASTPPSPAPLTGQSAVAVIAGPFVPAPLSPVFCALSGAWQGSVRLLRSTDGGASKLPLTVGGGDWGLFTGNACEAVWQEGESGASLWLDIRPTSGTVTYRVSQ